jgi:diadenylate cyclase
VTATVPDIDRFREILGEFDASSVIDVILIAAVIYLVLRLMSGTRAMTQARAVLGIVVFALLVGRAFDLTATNFIVRNSLPGILIGAAVLFQPEIRRTLDRLGRTGWGGSAGRAEVIDAVVLAAGRLSSARHGALVVFERGTGLEDVIETGVRVDARVSPELLGGIFFPNSPLHDMATILRDDRVVAAGCVLPLSDHLSDGANHLGTRHRAAVGITESTDAFSLVVSEETGDISVAVGGRLIRLQDERRLRSVLERLMTSRGARTPARAGA